MGQYIPEMLPKIGVKVVSQYKENKSVNHHGKLLLFLN